MFLDETSHLLPRSSGRHPFERAVQALDDEIQSVHLRRPIDHHRNPKGPVHIQERLIPRMKRELPTFRFQFGHLLLQELRIRVQGFIGQSRGLGSLAIKPFPLDAQQGVARRCVRRPP